MSDISSLMFRGESETLDFKRDQYRFIGESDDRIKGELLKDILAMANAWRTESAFILLGIDDSESPRRVIGIDKHIDDAALQQFVSGKTQKPVTFSYRSIELEGKSVGLIEIPVQPRPIYLRNAYGLLKANTVYLRRGSSTAEAYPDEVAQMGSADAKLAASDLHIFFVKIDSRDYIGAKISLDCVLGKISSGSPIPDFRPVGSHSSLSFYGKSANKDYYRQLVAVNRRIDFYRRVSVTAKNNGTFSASNIRVEFSVLDVGRNWEFRVKNALDINYPKQYVDITMVSIPQKIIDGIAARSEPSVEFQYVDGSWHIAFDFGGLQPKRTLWPSIEFYVGARSSGSLCLEGRILADGLANAASCRLEIAMRVEPRPYDLNTLVSTHLKKRPQDSSQV